MSTPTSQYATAQVGCMPLLTDPHRAQLISPFNHRRIEYAMALAHNQADVSSMWVGCEDSDGDNIWQDR